MLRLGVAFAILVAFGVACSSGDGDGGGAKTSCSGNTNACNHYDCICKDGKIPSSLSVCLNGVCGDESVCDGACDQNGGLASARVTPNVKDTPECAAFCEKALSLGCSENDDCNKWFYCDLEEGECAADKQASLKCQAETGTWECTANSWSMTSSCGTPKNCADGGN